MNWHKLVQYPAVMCCSCQDLGMGLTLHLCWMGYVSLVPTPCLNAFWHGRPYILLHCGSVFIIFVEATGLSEFTNYVHILRSVPHNHDVTTLVPSWHAAM